MNKNFDNLDKNILDAAKRGDTENILKNINPADRKKIEEIIADKNKLNQILATNTNQPYKKIVKDTERDYFMDAQEALKYGIIDKIIKKAA